MKRVLKILVVVIAIGTAAFGTSCSDDENSPLEITYTVNGDQLEVKTGESVKFSFVVLAIGGYASHTLRSTAGLGVIVTDNSTPGDGAKTFTISGSYTAGDVSGPDGIKLTVLDNEGTDSSAIITVDVLNN